MASGSDLQPFDTFPNSIMNGFSSPSLSDNNNMDHFSSHSPMPQSPTPAASHHTSPSSIPISDPPTPNDVAIDDDSSPSGSDIDAEGTDDDDYAQISHAPSARQIHVDPPTPSSSSSLNESTKRKLDTNGDEDFRNNPELYGLRRSGRARTDRILAESSAEDDDSDSDVKPRVKKARLSHRPTTNSVSETPLTHSSSDEDHDFLNNKRDKASARKKQHLRDIAHGLAPPSAAHQRFSSRQKTSAITYNETSDFDDEDDVKEWQYVDEAADASPYIDAILGFRIKPGKSIKDDDLTKADFDYWVKWQNEAHIHAKWHPYEDIKAAKGFRKIQNYWLKTIQSYLYYENEPSAALEDKEAFMMKHEQTSDEYEHNQKIDRVIGVGDEEDGTTKYYVKWEGIPYENCTWEDADFISHEPNGQEKIDAFINRSQRMPTSDKKQSWSSTPVEWRRRFFAEQPSYIQGGILRDFQKLGVSYLCVNWCKRDNVIIADEMGLGKTVQTVSFVSWLIHEKKQEGPHLIVVPLSTLPAWMETFAKWAPDVNAVAYLGSSESRKVCQEWELLSYGDIRRPKFNVLVTTYEYIINDTFLATIHWQFLGVDEAHRLKNRDSQLYNLLMQYHVPAKLLITGTPMQNSIEELSALLDFLNPGRIEAPANIDDLPPEEGAQILKVFKEAIRPFMLRRTKNEVEKDLPPKTEKIIRVECAALQREVYQNIITRNYAALNEGVNGQKQSLLNIMMEMKKCANHPFLFPGVEDRVLQGDTSRESQLRAITTSSGKMMLLDKLLTKMKAEGHRVLIFTQLVSMLNILNDYLQMKGYKFERLDGTVSSANRRQAIDRFNAPGSEDFAFILSTRAGGLGINLATADTIVLFDSDWNPHLDIQAMARAHRIGQTRPVSVFRFVSQDTVEEEILERARNKLVLEFILIQSGADDDEAKKRRKLLSNATEAPQTAEDMTDILKRRSQKMFAATDTQKRLEELDINSVLATAEVHQTKEASAIDTSDGGFDFMQAMITSVKFEGGWDDIIPKEKIAALEEEEKRRKEQEATEKLLEENKPRKRKPATTEREQREAKKRARKSAAAMAADSDDDGKSQASDDESDSDKDPKRPLNKKEWRNLIRACERYGSLSDPEVQQKIVKDGRLTGRDLNVLQAAYDEISNLCKSKIEESREQAEAEDRALKVPTKKEKKAVLIEHQGVKRINCETFLERATDMQMVRDLVNKAGSLLSFRIPEATKAAHYTCSWGAKEDAMLVVGLARHGFGGWQPMQADEDLGLQGKFFLEENRAENKKDRGENKTSKSPGAVHLVRRANYLITVLRDKLSNGTDPNARRVAENHHRNNKKAPRDRVRVLKQEGTPVGSPATNGSASPRPRPDRPRSSSNVDARASERPDSRASNESSGVRRKHENDDDGRDYKRRRLSDDNHVDRPAKPTKNGSSKPALDDRERERKRKEQRRMERRDQLRLGDGMHDARDRAVEKDHPPRHKDDRRRDRDHYSRERSRSPRRDREKYRDRNDYRDGYRDERRSSKDHHHDRERHRERSDRPYSRDGHSSHRPDSRHKDDRRDRYPDDSRAHDRGRDHRDDRSHHHKDHKDRHRDDHRHRDDRDRDHKTHDKHETTKKDNPAASYFAKKNRELLSSTRAANSAAATDSIPKEERVKTIMTALAALWNFIEKENLSDPSKPSKEDLWKHAAVSCWTRNVKVGHIMKQSESCADKMATKSTSITTAQPPRPPPPVATTS